MLRQAAAGHAWWRGATIYQVYPRSFADSNGDGIGDLPGLTARLDYIARLGVDAIWLCPVFASPQRDFGYDVADHLEIDPIFGTLADFDAMLARAHRLGLRVIIDQVWSHTSSDHPWFRKSRAAQTGPYADWFVWADPSPDGTPPNNWLSVFSGAAWTWEPRRRQYYLHHFLAHQPQLNLYNPLVQEALLRIGAFWLDRGVDGFRLDALDFFCHDPALRANPPAPPSASRSAKLFGRQLHVHDMMQPATFDFLARVRALTDRYPGAVTLGEVSSQDGAFGRCRDYTAGADRLHMAYTLRPSREKFDWAGARALVEEAAQSPGWLCWSFSNHDVERALSRWDPGGGGAPDPRFARLLLRFQLSLRGSILLYQGEELGLTEADLQEDELRDPFGIALWPEFRGRDGSRTPMPWIESAPHGGFTSAQPWLPLPDAHLPLAADAQERDETALLHEWRRFLAFRRAHPAMISGALHALDLRAPLIGFVRENAEEKITFVFNLSAQPVWTETQDFLPPYGVAILATSLVLS